MKYQGLFPLQLTFLFFFWFRVVDVGKIKERGFSLDLGFQSFPELIAKHCSLLATFWDENTNGFQFWWGGWLLHHWWLWLAGDALNAQKSCDLVPLLRCPRCRPAALKQERFVYVSCRFYLHTRECLCWQGSDKPIGLGGEVMEKTHCSTTKLWLLYFSACGSSNWLTESQVSKLYFILRYKFFRIQKEILK